MKHILLALLVVLAVGSVAPSLASASSNHVCNAGDPPITASAKTSCPMAGNILNAYYNGRTTSVGFAGYRSAWVKSPVTGQSYMILYKRRGHTVTATGHNGIRATFQVW